MVSVVSTSPVFLIVLSSACSVMICFIGFVTSKSPPSSPVSSRCLQCLCEVESGCKPPYPTCHAEYVYLPCGPLGLTYIQWEEAQNNGAGQLAGKSFEECASEVDCSGKVLQAYMSRYKPKKTSRYSGDRGRCEYYSKVHKGGPDGPHLAPTKAFWDKVASCWDRLETEEPDHEEL